MSHPVLPLVRPVAMALVALLVFTADAVRAEPVIEAISSQMPGFIRRHKVAGAVGLVATRDRILHVEAVGWADLAARRRMTIDAVFDIASMGKPFTAVAILMLREEGRLHLDDEAVKYLPELAALKGPDGAPARPTIRQLLTHTAGFPFGGNTYLRGMPNADALSVPALVTTKPLLFKPGAKFQYSSPGYALLGTIVERVTGRPLGEFLQERLFTPLGMSSTRWIVAADEAASLVTIYTAKPSGALEPFVPPQFKRGNPRIAAGGGGEFSTVRDYLRFARMLLNGGEYEGRRYLSAASVAEMTSAAPNTVGDGAWAPVGYGFGLMVHRDTTGIAPQLAPGAYGHFGGYGTHCWLDPKRGLIALLFTQRAGAPGEELGQTGLDFTTVAFAAVAQSGS